MRIMALDYGDKRIGVAISDETKTFASYSKTLFVSSLTETIDELVKICAEKDVSDIVVGIPITMSGENGQMSLKVKEFAYLLNQKTNHKIILWDERLTTSEAEKVLMNTQIKGKRRRDLVDQVAAKIILQAYLDSINNSA